MHSSSIAFRQLHELVSSSVGLLVSPVTQVSSLVTRLPQGPMSLVLPRGVPREKEGEDESEGEGGGVCGGHQRGDDQVTGKLWPCKAGKVMSGQVRSDTALWGS